MDAAPTIGGAPIAGCLCEETLSIILWRMKMAEEAKAAAFGNDVEKDAERLEAEWANVNSCSALAPRGASAKAQPHRAVVRGDWPGPGRCIA